MSGRWYRFGEPACVTSVAMPETLKRLVREHAKSRGVSFSRLVVDCLISGLRDRDGRVVELSSKEGE